MWSSLTANTSERGSCFGTKALLHAVPWDYDATRNQLAHPQDPISQSCAQAPIGPSELCNFHGDIYPELFALFFLHQALVLLPTDHSCYNWIRRQDPQNMGGEADCSHLLSHWSVFLCSSCSKYLPLLCQTALSTCKKKVKLIKSPLKPNPF